MGLIMPESGGLHLPSSSKGIERTAAPDGFEWVNGVLSPVAKQKQGIIASTDAEAAHLSRARFEEEQNQRGVERAAWGEAGFGKSAFLVPDQFDFIELATKAVIARSGIASRRMARFSGASLRAALGISGMDEPVPRFDFYLKPEEARAVFNALQNLHESFSAEFRVNERAQEAYFATAFYITKFGKTPKKEGGGAPWSPEFLDLLLAEFPTLDRNTNAYAYAKSILKQNAERFGQTEARVIAATLHRNNDLYTDLGFLLYSAHSGAFEGLVPPDERVWQLPPAELAANVERYGALASNELPKAVPPEGSKIGYEIELALAADDYGEVEPLGEFAAVSGGEHGPDGNVYELRTKDGGQRFDSRAAMSLIRLGVAAEGNKECAGVASVHINLDADRRETHGVFLFRKEEDTRVEMQAVGKPYPRAGTPQLAEMAVVIDQTEVLRGLYRSPPEEQAIGSFLEYKLKEFGGDATELFSMNPAQLECEFLIREAQRSKRSSLVPAILRLYSRNALPMTFVPIEVLDLWERHVKEHVPVEESGLEFSDSVGEYLRRLYYENFAMQAKLASAVKELPFNSFVNLFPVLATASISTLIRKISPTPEAAEVYRFLADGNSLGSYEQTKLLSYFPDTMPFSPLALDALRGGSVAWTNEVELVGKLRGHRLADIEAFLLDPNESEEVKWQLALGASDFTTIAQHGTLLRQLEKFPSLHRWIEKYNEQKAA